MAAPPHSPAERSTASRFASPSGSQSSLEALLSADQESRPKKDRTLRYTQDQSRSRDRTISSIVSSGGASDYLASSTPPTSNNSNWVQNQINQAAVSGDWSGIWSGEPLPSNAAGYSSSSTSADSGSLFFPPGGSALSFEGSGRGESGSSALSRERSPLEPSRGSFPRGKNGVSPGQSSWDDRQESVRGLSPGLGGGRKRKDASRGLSYAVAVNSTGDRGMVGLAKPGDKSEGRVAVAGRTCESALLLIGYPNLICLPRRSKNS